MAKQKNNLHISLIIPCYNEEENIKKGVLDEIGNFTNSDERITEIIIVDDGSTDKSIDIIKKKYLSLFPKYRLIKKAHQGKAFAIIRGIHEAKSNYVMFSDIDLATPIEEVDKLVSKAVKGADIVIGSRSGRRDGAPLTRKIMALGMIFIRNYIIGLRGINDTQCGFKLFDRNAANKIISSLHVFKTNQIKQGSSVSAGFDLEFLFVASKLGYSIQEVPVIWRHVETKNVTFMKSSIEGLKDILQIKWYDLQNKYPN